MSDKIESVLRETRRFPPPQSFAAANVAGRTAYDALVKEASDDWQAFWKKHAETELDWQKPFSRVYNGDDAPFHRWFEDGELNISANCLDRHLPTRAEQPAILFEDDGGNVRVWTYRQLHDAVCKFANGLKQQGLRRSERVIIYMPMRPEAVIAMQACARLGAIHSVVFGGFSAKSLEDRIKDAGAAFVITADESLRGGKAIPLKNTVDEALANTGDIVRRVVMLEAHRRESRYERRARFSLGGHPRRTIRRLPAGSDER